MIKKITLLFALLAGTLSHGQSDGDTDISAIFTTGLESANTCDASLERKNMVDGETNITIVTDSRDALEFNVSWLFKRYDESKAKFTNKKVPEGSTIAQIIGLSGSGFSVNGLNTTGAGGVLSLGTAPCVSQTGAKVFASLQFTGFDAIGGDSTVLTVTSNPNEALDNTIYAKESFTITIQHDATTASVNQLEKFNFSYAPNPTKDFIQLSAANPIQGVQIYNLLGQEVLQNAYNLRNAKVDVSALNEGVYVLKVVINDKIGTYKFMKE